MANNNMDVINEHTADIATVKQKLDDHISVDDKRWSLILKVGFVIVALNLLVAIENLDKFAAAVRLIF